MANKAEVTVGDVTVYVKKPGHYQLKKAQLQANKTFNEARKEGGITRSGLDEWMREEGHWNTEKEDELVELGNKISDGLAKLRKGKAGVESPEAGKKLALSIGEWRSKQFRLLAQKAEFDAYTIEAQAENARFDYLVSVCTLKEDGSRYFESLEDYWERADEEISYKSASKLRWLLDGVDDDWEKDLPENKFLKKYGFINDEMRLINKEGKYIDREGNLVDKEGYLINKAGERVDSKGNKLDEKGMPIDEDFVEFDEFIEKEETVYNPSEDAEEKE